MTKQLSICCKAEIDLTGKDRPNAFECSKCGRIIGTGLKKTKNRSKEWEKEFSKRFTDNVLPNGHGNDLIITKEDVEPLMNFIQSLLDQQKAEFVEMVRGMRVGIGHPNHVLDLARRNGYNQAIDEAISIIKRYMK